MTAGDASAGESFLKDNHLRDKNDDYQCRERLLRPPHYLTIFLWCKHFQPCSCQQVVTIRLCFFSALMG